MDKKIILLAYVCLSTILMTSIFSYLGYGTLSPIATTEASTKTPIRKPEDVKYASIKVLPSVDKPNDNKVRMLEITKTLTPEGLTSTPLSRSYYGSDRVVSGSAISLNRYVESPKDIDLNRKRVLNTSAKLLYTVPYFWGGKPANAGWNNQWCQDVVVSPSGIDVNGNVTTSTEPVIAKHGLDCSGFVDWVYWTSLGYRIGYSTDEQWHKSRPISEEELLPGDLAFLYMPSNPHTNHVGIYIGANSIGQKKFIHCCSGQGVIVSSPSFKYYRRPYIDLYY